MTSFDLLGLATELAATSARHFVIIDCWNNGSDSRWGQQFPSIDFDDVESPASFAIEYETAEEAAHAFQRIARESVENDTGMIGGSVTLVTGEASPYFARRGEVTTARWKLDDATLPVLGEDGWTSEIVAERL